MGGIVNVVISVAALTGVPLYLPIIWALFSKRQTAKSVMFATLFSLSLNAFFKFVTPYLFDFSFNRAEEMATGVIFPVLILLIWEIYASVIKHIDPNYTIYKRNEDQIVVEEPIKGDNSKSILVIGIGISASAILIMALGIIAHTGKLLVCSVASIMLILGLVCIYKSMKK